MNPLYVLLFVLISVVYCDYFGKPCIPYRENYRLKYTCDDDHDAIGEEEDRLAQLKGEPSRFARTGFYDRLFRDANTIAWQGQYAYYPNYGFNANYPNQGPYHYRYSNHFTKNNAQ